LFVKYGGVPVPQVERGGGTQFPLAEASDGAAERAPATAPRARCLPWSPRIGVALHSVVFFHHRTSYCYPQGGLIFRIYMKAAGVHGYCDRRVVGGGGPAARCPRPTIPMPAA